MSNDMSSLESEIEATRVRLASTFDQLIYRSSPKTIARRVVASFKAHFVDPASGQPRTDNILKVVGGAVGVFVLLGVIRKIVRD